MKTDPKKLAENCVKALQHFPKKDWALKIEGTIHESRLDIMDEVIISERQRIWDAIQIKIYDFDFAKDRATETRNRLKTIIFQKETNNEK